MARSARPTALAAAQLAAAGLLVLAGCGGGSEGPRGSEAEPERGSEPLPGGPSSERVTLRPAGSVEGAPLGYIEYLPPGYGDGTPRPLLVFLHGGGENGDGSQRTLGRLSKLGVPMLIQNDDWPDDRPFIVLMPQFDEEAVQECLLADEVDSFLRFAMDHYDVDQSRVYLTGVSCGAIGAWDYLAAHADEVVAGAVVIAGHATDAFARAGCELGRVPIWAFHGEVDSIVPVTYIETPMKELEECTDPAPVDVRLTVYPGVDHDGWNETYDLSAGHDIYAWLLGHEHR